MRKLIESVSGAVQIAARILLYPLLRRRRRRWGTSEEEMALRLPGDELAAEPRWTHTTRSRSMPAVGRLAWLVQLGQGGFYTYEGLENLVGCQFRNVMGIRPELQQLPAGDTIVLHGRSGFGPEVVSLNPERALVLGGPPNEMGSQATWGF